MLIKIALTSLGISVVLAILTWIWVRIGVNQLGFINPSLWTKKESLIVSFCGICWLGVYTSAALIIIAAILNLWGIR